MIFIPFLFFSSILFGLLYKRRRFDLAAYIASLYSLISFFAILVEYYDLRYMDCRNYEISFEATLAYCLLLFSFLLPIIHYTSKSFFYLNPVENTSFLKLFSILSVVFFGVTLLGSFTTLMNVLNGDMNALRHAVYLGEAEAAWFASYPFVIREPIIVGNLIFGAFWVLQFLGFFSLLIQKIEIKYSVFYFIASLLGPLWGILAIDRSKVTYWIIAFFANYFFFSLFMTERQKKTMKVCGFILICVLLVYLSAMTNSRFEERYYGSGISGSAGSVISYLGQPFIHFAFFYDSFSNPKSTLALIFPFIHKYVLGTFGSGVEVQQNLTSIFNLQFGVFYTFLGQILISAGKIVMIAYCLIMSLSAFFLFNPDYISRDSLWKQYLFMAYSSIMFLGLFVHYYANSTGTFSVVFFLIFFKFLRIPVK